MCPEIDHIIDAAIEQRQVNGGYKHYRQYNRCKSHLKGKQAKFALDNPLILELDNRVEATYKSYLV